MQKSTVFLDTKTETSEKEKLIHNSIKSNEILRNRFNQGGENL